MKIRSCVQNLTMQRELATERAAAESVRAELGARALEAQDERAANERSHLTQCIN